MSLSTKVLFTWALTVKHTWRVLPEVILGARVLPTAKLTFYMSIFFVRRNMNNPALFNILLVYRFRLHHHLSILCQQWKKALMVWQFLLILLVFNDDFGLILAWKSMRHLLWETRFTSPDVIPALIIDSVATYLGPFEHVEKSALFLRFLGFPSHSI
jgi:hypothetical protein